MYSSEIKEKILSGDDISPYKHKFFARMFKSCDTLKTIPFFNSSHATNMIDMFMGCTSLESIPLLNTSKVTKMSHMFTYCTSLKSIPLLNTSKVKTMKGMFNRCESLKSIPLLNTSNVTDMIGMFHYCTSLETIPLLDTSKVINIGSTFDGCKSLTIESIKNIIEMLKNMRSSKRMLEDKIREIQTLLRYYDDERKVLLESYLYELLIQIYEKTNDKKYLPKAAQDIFVF